MTIKYHLITEKDGCQIHQFRFSPETARDVRLVEGIKPGVSFDGGRQVRLIDDDSGSRTLRKPGESEWLELRVLAKNLPEIPTDLPDGECHIYESGKGVIGFVLPVKFSRPTQWPNYEIPEPEDREALMREVIECHREIATLHNRMGGLLVALGFQFKPIIEVIEE